MHRSTTWLAAALVAAIFAVDATLGLAGTTTFSGQLSATSPTTIFEGQSVSVAVAYRLNHTGTSSGNTGQFYYNFVLFTSGNGQQFRDYANGRDYSGQQNWSGLSGAVVGSEPFHAEAQPSGWPGTANGSPGKVQDFSTSFTYLDDGGFTLNAHGDSSVGPVFGFDPKAALWYSTGGTPSTGIQGPVFNENLAITVLNVDPTITSAPGESTEQAGMAFPLSAAATDPGVLDVFTFSWDLDGDGLYDDYIASPGAGGSQSSSTSALLTTPGDYTLGVRVTDGDGGVDTQSFLVHVVPEPSSIFLAGLAGLALVAAGRRHGRPAAR